ncbi:MAG: transcription-repair coupling factor [Verrucomicrobia bacterium]|nr:transcription-repair coupling factor [Verrucomicrobiota bacterium]
MNFTESRFLENFNATVAEGSSLILEGLTPPSKALLLARAIEASNKPLLVLTGAGVEEFKLYNDLPFFSKHPIVELASWEMLPSENIAPSPDIVGSRFKALQTIKESQNDSKPPCIILSTLQAALQKLLPPEAFKELFLTLKRKDRLRFDELLFKLERLGYERKAVACEKGEYAYRGGIVDIFPVTSTEPYRIEFWGDEIESIRAYDSASQKSASHLDSIELSAAKEATTGELTTVFDYLKDCIVVFDDLEALEDRYASLTSLGAGSSKTFLGIEELLDLAQKQQCLYFTTKPIETLSEVQADKKVKFYSHAQGSTEITFEMFLRTLSAKRINSPLQPLGQFFEDACMLDYEPANEELIDALHQLQQQDPHTVYILTQSDNEESTFEAKLKSKAHTHFVRGYLSQGFVLKDAKVIVFPMTELTGRVKIRRQRQRTYYQSASWDAFDIVPGETVVHFNHGIGKFLGVEKRPNHQGVEEEYFLIEYAEKAKLYVPLTQAHLISKYVGAGEETPKLHGLGNTKWKKSREQTEKAIIGYASELLKFYAERQMQGGFSFAEDSSDTKLFDEEFPYIETEDQLQAINDVKKDMMSSKAMDRLVCGDVGYGKTEVAMRAAFKAVVDGKKQVAVLVPTTVLAIQHYENFRDRMQDFGIRVEVLSRFRTAKETKKSIELVEKGAVDIIVGTHRLLQKDMIFKDLGLIIIDEEQRFGVKAKEHLKMLKTGVDCLTLSATPIPRTLYMSLVGARDLSVISTPPQDRLPIKTIIADPDDQLIQTALLRELNRDGQVYFIHNRIESIYERASYIQKLLPKARIGIGHGQMDGDELDLVFHGFKKGELDILVATSIVENGIDIPNANTIIVDDADHFGIADLYQLRGRVGRWNRRAFAYFIVPKRRSLSEVAKKRLDAIAQAGGYGGGMRVAMRDLEMRGAGNIIGIEQSGHVSSVGFHLYCKMLKRMIDSLQGKAPSYSLETRVEIPFDARLPDFYVNEVSLRMEIYQRLGDAFTQDEVDAIWAEVKDRFGTPPEQAVWLYHLSRLRVLAAARGYTHVKIENVSLFYERKSGDRSLSNRILLPKIKSPEDLEKKVSLLLPE